MNNVVCWGDAVATAWVVVAVGRGLGMGENGKAKTGKE